MSRSFMLVLQLCREQKSMSISIGTMMLQRQLYKAGDRLRGRARRGDQLTRLRLNPSGSKCLLDIKHFLRGCFAVSFIFYTGSDDNKFSTHNCLHKKFNNGLSPLHLALPTNSVLIYCTIYYLVFSKWWTRMIFY